MKKISLLFVLGVLFCRHAEAGSQELDMAEATGAAVSGTAEANAWSLNNATSNTASSIIDLTAYRGIKIQVTGTAGASVKVAFSNVSYSAASFFTKLVMLPGEIATLDRHGDYVKLTTGDAPNSSVKASAITQRLGTASSTVTLSGVSGVDARGSSVVAYQGTSPWGVDARGSSVVANAAMGGTLVSNANPLAISATALLVAYGSLSTHAVPMTTAYSQDITAALGITNGYAYRVCLGATGANNFWYEWSQSATPPTTYSYLYSISTTPVCIPNLAPGYYIHASVTAATLSATVKVLFDVKRP